MTIFWIAVFVPFIKLNMTHTSKNNLNHKPMVTLINIRKNYVDFSSFQLSLFSKILTTNERNQTTTNLSRKWNLLTPYLKRPGSDLISAVAGPKDSTCPLPLALFQTDSLIKEQASQTKPIYHSKDVHQASLTTLAKKCFLLLLIW